MSHMFNEFIYTTTYKDLEIKFHWSIILTLISAVYYQSYSLFAMFIAFFSVIFIILAHELGHYFVARRYNYDVYTIVIHYLGGYCEHEEPYYQFEDSMIAFGGVFAQLLILIFSLIIVGILSLLQIPINNLLYSLFISMLVFYNLFIIIFNLLPFKGFDGYSAWRIFRYVNVKLPEIKKNKTHKKKKIKPKLTPEQVKMYADKFINDAIKKAKKNKP